MPARKKTNRAAISAILKRTAKDFHLSFWSKTTEQIGVMHREGVPVQLHFTDTGKDALFAYVSIRTTSWEFDGERTDLHDTLSVALATCLRLNRPAYSVTLWDVTNPAGVPVPESELYSRYLTFDQPNQSTFRLDRDGRAQIRTMVAAIAKFILLLPTMLEWDSTLEAGGSIPLYDYKSPGITRWGSAVLKAIGRKMRTGTELALRRNPHWMYLRKIRPAISVSFNPRLVAGLRIFLDGSKRDTVRVSGHDFCVSQNVENVIPKPTRLRLESIQRRLPDESAHRAAIIPCENHCIMLGKRHLVWIESDTGIATFRRLKEQRRNQFQREAAILFKNNTITLKKQFDDESFEEMILLLLQREPNVHWAKKMGHAREPEGGQDIVAEWDVRPTPTQPLPPDQVPLFRCKVVVQCKAVKGSVGKSQVQDIRDLLEFNQAHGFLLVTASHITVALIRHLTTMRASGKFWADWWTRTDIEERLERNADVAHRFARFLAIRPRSFPRVS